MRTAKKKKKKKREQGPTHLLLLLFDHLTYPGLALDFISDVGRLVKDGKLARVRVVLALGRAQQRRRGGNQGGEGRGDDKDLWLKL